MKRLFKKMLSSVLAASMAVSLVPVQVSASAPGEEAVYVETIDESITYENGNAIQSYVAEDGTVHTLYWAKGITPPRLSGTPGEDGLYGDFTRVVESGKNSEFITYQVPFTPGMGYFDMNKINASTDPRCYLATATNLIYWWMEQNAPYIDQYVEELQSGQKFQQGEGLVAFPATKEAWNTLRVAPDLVLSHNLYGQLLDDSNLVRKNGPFSKNYNLREEGYYADLVIDFFINGYQAINTESAAENVPEKFEPDPEGGFFYPVFGKNVLTTRNSVRNVDYYSENVKKWLLEGKAMGLSYLTNTVAHAITLWGAEYDSNGQIFRVFVTDSDDNENVGAGDLVRGLHGMNIIVDENNVVHLGNAVNTEQYPGAYINAITTIDLGQDTWEAVLQDPEPAPGEPVILEEPKSRNYGKDAMAEPLVVVAEVPEKDLDKSAYLTYQWYEAADETGEGRKIEGAIQNSYTPQIGNNVETKYYYCEVTNHKYGKNTGKSTIRARISVQDVETVHAAAPRIRKNINPYQVITYAKGEKAAPIEILAESTDGGTLSYQWYQTYSSQTENGTPIKGQTGNTLTPPTNEVSDRLFYFCEITNTNTTVNGRTSTSVLTPVQRIKVVEAEPQEPLEITNVPVSSPVYGQEFYLGTQGGSGSGAVSWEITEGNSVAKIEAATGKVTITGVGTFRVKAVKAGAGMFQPAQAEQTITAVKAEPQIGTVSISGNIFTDSTKAELEAGLTRSNQELPGTLTITEKNISLRPGRNTLTWLFTPEDKEHYTTKTGKVTFTVQERQKKILDLGGIHWRMPGNLKYNGTEQSISMEGTLPEEVEMKITGTTKAVHAGTYRAEASFQLKKGLDPKEYEIRNGENRAVSWSIQKAEGEKAPEVTGSYKVSSQYKDSFLYTVHAIPGAEYKMDKGSWQKENTFDGLKPGSGHTFYARIQETEDVEAGKEGHSTKIYFEKLENEKVPELKVVIEEKKDGSSTVSIEETAGAEYSFDGGKTFGKLPVKEGLKPGTTVETAIRYKETPVLQASSIAWKTIQIPEKKKTGVWKTSGIRWWYQRADGTYPADRWEQIDGYWYHFDKQGWMQKGWLLLGPNWFYLNGSGHMVTGWQAVGKKWYYFYDSGRMLKGWQKIDGYWYYLKSSGEMTKGWAKIGRNTFYFNGSGHMATGKQKINGTWYTFDANGALR